MQEVYTTHGTCFITYDDPYAWAVDNLVPFWEKAGKFPEIKASNPVRSGD